MEKYTVMHYMHITTCMHSRGACIDRSVQKYCIRY